MILENKSGINFGVADKHSLAWLAKPARRARDKHLILVVIVCLVSLGMPVHTPAQKSPTGGTQKLSPDQDTSSYRQLVLRVKKGDQTVDFVQLRDAFREWLCNDKVNTDAPNRDAMVKAFDDRNYSKAAELIDEVLDYEFVNRGLHLAAETAYRQLGNQAKADYHKSIAHKLLHAVLNSGDGKSTQTAFRVLSVSEEYFVMRQLGYSSRSQALVSEKNKPYDVLMGNDDDTGKDVKVYFDISSFFGGCEGLKKSSQ